MNKDTQECGVCGQIKRVVYDICSFCGDSKLDIIFRKKQENSLKSSDKTASKFKRIKRK